MTNHHITLKNILISVGILALVGIILFAVGKNEKNIYVPSTYEIGHKSGLLLGMVIVYILFSIAMLWVFFSPQTTKEKIAVAGAGILWGIF